MLEAGARLFFLGDTWLEDINGLEKKEMLGCICVLAKYTEGFLNKYTESCTLKERGA